MIESIYARWFLNHDRTELELSPGVTTLQGRSGSGKSALIRALWWLFRNEPLGEQFIGKWRKAKYALVRAVVDGRNLLRKRGSKTNLYKLDSKTLKAFGATPPRPVSDLANVGPLNLQGQGESYFWFTLSKAELSRRLNEVVRLDVIDRALKAIGSEVRKANAHVDVCRERLQEAKQQREHWGWATDFDVKIGKIEKIRRQREKLALDRATIDSAVTAISRAVQTRQNTAELIVGVNRVVQIGLRRRRLRQRLAEIQSLTEQLVTTERLNKPLPSLAKLIQLRVRRQRIATRRRALETIVHAAEYATMELDSLTEQVEQCEAQVKARVGEICPWCGRVTKLPVSSRIPISQTSYPSPEGKHVRSGIKPRRTTVGNSLK